MGSRRASANRRDPRADAPYVTWALALVILGVAVYGTGLFPTEASIEPYTWSRADMAQGEWDRLFLSMFAHGGLLHLVVNLVALLSLGAYAESRLGHLPFLVLYVAAGVGGGVLHAASTPIPGVGASGAVFGLMGLMILLNPTALLSILFLFPLPAVVAMALYVALVAFVPAFADAGNVAHMAHLGGLVTGAAFGFAAEPRAALRHLPGIALTFAGVVAIVLWGLSTDFAAIGHAFEAQDFERVFVLTWPLLVWGGLTGLAVWLLSEAEGEAEAGAG